MANAVIQNSQVADHLVNFRELLKTRASFFQEILGTKEYENIAEGWFDDQNSFDINPTFEWRGQLENCWQKILTRFSNNDPNLNHYLSRASIEDTAKWFKEIFFNYSDITGLAVLISGSYDARVFNRDDVVGAARSFLDKTNADDYMLITACGPEVMVQPVEGGDKKWENRFLELITDEAYSDRVFPFQLPESPEFRFAGRLYKPRKNGSKQRCEMAFDICPMSYDV